MPGIERLREEVEQLRSETNRLKENLKLQNPQSVRERSGSDRQHMEVESFRAQIRKHHADAPILKLHDELLRAEQRCTQYADALAESKGNFVNMKRLYQELSDILDGCSA
ncbi:uncharacterized protein TEOVI_000160800 [Trypanosoma equiperdum]|uniref:Uncharacterized protein n=2 Tax=Trypanozoon TaxID=39700 RepID=Q385V0_TRYB2|nr:hypothetical protein, conserved [Trypanosoma brucei brucei TREU927]EAN79431.1 hypothetical protein, conserved [Trypanosoma brucei brucei TREU927]SCU70039.1 hypothetical protein, conserved [Trypanosoma equiperdum]